MTLGIYILCLFRHGNWRNHTEYEGEAGVADQAKFKLIIPIIPGLFTRIGNSQIISLVVSLLLGLIIHYSAQSCLAPSLFPLFPRLSGPLTHQ
jgi:hypothetical protein